MKLYVIFSFSSKQFILHISSAITFTLLFSNQQGCPSFAYGSGLTQQRASCRFLIIFVDPRFLDIEFVILLTALPLQLIESPHLNFSDAERNTLWNFSQARYKRFPAFLYVNSISHKGTNCQCCPIHSSRHISSVTQRSHRISSLCTYHLLLRIFYWIIIVS